MLSNIFNRFCLEFFGLKNQTRGHVSYMSLNELSIVIVIIILLIINIKLSVLLKIFRRRKISKLDLKAYVPIKFLQ